MVAAKGATVLLCDSLYLDRGKVSILGAELAQVDTSQDRITAYVSVQLPWPEVEDSLDVGFEMWRQQDYHRTPQSKPRALQSATVDVRPPRKRPRGVPLAQVSFGMEVGVTLQPDVDYLAVVKIDGTELAWAPFSTAP